MHFLSLKNSIIYIEPTTTGTNDYQLAAQLLAHLTILYLIIIMIIKTIYLYSLFFAILDKKYKLYE